MEKSNVRLDTNSGNGKPEQQRELDSAMEMGQSLAGSKNKGASYIETEGVVLLDTFRGGIFQLIDSIKSLVELDMRNALVPHGIGGHARNLFSSAAIRLEQLRQRVAELEAAKIAGELNAEMSKTIGSKEYNEWLNSPLTKAMKRSFEQSITDPENQPSQYGTVTLAMYEHLEEQITASQQRVAELETQLAKNNPLLDEAADAIDKLTAERDLLLKAMALAMPVMDAHAGPTRLADFHAAIASVKEKS